MHTPLPVLLALLPNLTLRDLRETAKTESLAPHLKKTSSENWRGERRACGKTRTEREVGSRGSKMAKRTKEMRLIIVFGGIVFFGVLAYSTLQQTQKEYEVCLAFKERSHCATARGSTPEEAIRSARDIDCTLITNGRDESMACTTSSRRASAS